MTDSAERAARRITGWDERDYKLWSDIRCLRSYGVISPNDRMISRDEVLELLEAHALARESAQPKGEESGS